MSNPPQDENVSVRDINLINEEWQRQLVGRKYVKHEDDGFDDLKVDFCPHYPFSLWLRLMNNSISSSLQECQQ
jgi:hypothetical protein